MSDIELVIKIPEGLKKDFESEQWTALSCMEMKDALMNGTPLPKGHGRLIDADALEKLCYEHEIGNSAFDGEPIIAQGQYDDGDNIWKSLFDFAPTIIEAEKAESEVSEWIYMKY